MKKSTQPGGRSSALDDRSQQRFNAALEAMMLVPEEVVDETLADVNQAQDAPANSGTKPRAFCAALSL